MCVNSRKFYKPKQMAFIDPSINKVYIIIIFIKLHECRLDLRAVYAVDNYML